MQTTAMIVDRDGSKTIQVKLGSRLNDSDEHWFMEYLMKSSGIAYVEHDIESGRLTGYGVWEPWWDQFRFWLGVGLLDNGEDDDLCQS